MKIFISHAHKDFFIIREFVELLYNMGLQSEDMFCSLIEELGIPLKENIYEYLREMLDKDDIYTFFMLSDNYYASVACLNEMGAVWVRQKEYISFLLPGFQYDQIEGAIDPRAIAIDLGGERNRLRTQLNQLKDELTSKFGSKVNNERWEKCRDRFMDALSEAYDTQNLSKVAKIDLTNSRTFCIGENLSNGCISHFKNLPEDCVEVTYDFSKTKTNLCSFVTYIDNADWSRLAEKEKYLSVEVRGALKLKNIRMEIHLEEKHIERQLDISKEFQTYRFRLLDLCSNINMWSKVKEVNFLAEKRNAPEKSRLYIRNLHVE